MQLKISNDLSLDLLRLVDSRMLIQANSGGGKSWLLRLLAERANEQVQTIILDPEGEFVTLRERFDFLLIGEGGEIPAETRSASLLARKLIELQASAVIDLYDLKLPDRRRFVRFFLEALMHLPKTLWHPVIIMLDEAHLFCPERSAGEAESAQAVIDLMSQGRKRSFCGILATQRLSKLHKDAEAETNNVVIGRTWLDIDQERAGKLLGFGKDRASLRDLEPGSFFGFGPAFSKHGIQQFKADSVQTTHPKAGQRHKLTPPKPSEAVRRIVADLADLPQQAEAEIRDLGDAKKKIAELERELRTRPKEEVVKKEIERVEVPVLKNGQLDKATGLVDRMQKLMNDAREIYGPLASAIGRAAPSGHIPVTSARAAPATPVRPAESPPTPVAAERTPAGHSQGNGVDITIGRCERAILTALAQYEQGRSMIQIAVLTGYSVTSGGFKNSLGKLRSAGMITREHPIRIIEAGLAALGEWTPLPTGEDLQRHWLNELPKCEKAVLGALLHVYPEGLLLDELADRIGYSRTSGGFKNSLGRLRTLELITRGHPIKASEEFFQ